VTEKIYKILNFTQHVDQQDPDIFFIKKEIERIPEASIMDFYVHLVSSDRYYTQSRVLSRDMLPKAAAEFIRQAKESRYKDLDIDNRAEQIAFKLKAIAKSLQSKSTEEQNSYLVGVTEKLDGFKVLIDGERKRLFDKKEIEFLKQGRLRDLVRIALDTHFSEQEFIQYVALKIIEEEGGDEISTHSTKKTKKRVSILN